MKSKSFIIIGSLIFLAGAILLIWSLSNGMLDEALYKTFEVKGDYWIWWFIFIPVLTILSGAYYLSVGIKKKETNGLISVSAKIQLVALIIGVLVSPGFFISWFGYVLAAFVWLFTSFLIGIGIILLIIGWIKLKKTTKTTL